MGHLDVFYRAFRAYREALQKEHESKLLRDELVKEGTDEKVCVTQVTCHVEQDWVDAIDKGLVFIGKAIDEERQFIRSEGEVQPIEKVRHVSRESAEHLARHSNLITRAPAEGEDLLPEKLYTVERLNNYAVYENRFLYMVLCLLNDFISLRYNQIVRETNTYRGETTLHKSVTSGKRRLQCDIVLKEASDDDPYLRNRNELGEVLSRLERLQRSVYYYLHTPLMSEVAKADKLKPPVTKTNVLRMDKNFKEVVALYEFIVAYTRDGFTVTRQEHVVDLKDRAIAEEFSEPVLLMSFLTYEHGMDISDALRAEYEAEERRRREEEQRALREQVDAMRRRMREKGCTPEEYILLLERRNGELEKESEQLVRARATITALGEEKTALQKTIERCQEEIAQLNAAHTAELSRRDEQEETLRRKADEAEAEHAAALVEFTRKKADEIAALMAKNEQTVQELDTRLQQNDAKCAQLETTLGEREEQCALLHARLTALRREHGLLTDTDDYTSEAAFTELEHELEVLAKYARSQWTTAKQLLRREVFGGWLRARTAKNKRTAENVPASSEKERTTENAPARSEETSAAGNTSVSSAKETAAGDASEGFGHEIAENARAGVTEAEKTGAAGAVQSAAESGKEGDHGKDA